MTYTTPPNTEPETDWPNEVIHPARRLELARKAARFQVQHLADILGVSRNAISDYQTPGKLVRPDLNKILMWCLACEVRPSWVSPDYGLHDLAVEAKLEDLRSRDTNFAEEQLGYDPRGTTPPRRGGPTPDPTRLPSFLRVTSPSTRCSQASLPLQWILDDGGQYPDSEPAIDIHSTMLSSVGF